VPQTDSQTLSMHSCPSQQSLLLLHCWFGTQQTPPAQTPPQQSHDCSQKAPSGRQQRPSPASEQAAVSEQNSPSESQQVSVAGSQTARNGRQGSTHAPPWHWPFLPHAVPFEAVGLEQRPVAGSQTPAT
jgi:hypothetical protein